MNLSSMLRISKKNAYLILLILIFLLSFYIRSISIVPDRILSYDPVYMYRFTKYFVEFGFIPDWDELSYYVGRPSNHPPLMFYLTGVLYWFLKTLIPSITLLSVCAWASALYGAFMVIPAYLLGRELSNRKGGIIAASLVGFAPQILSRTFGSSYDTDQLVIFFILLTLYTGIRLLKKPNAFNFILNLFALTAFMLTWPMFWYTYFLVAIIFVVHAFLTLFLKSFDKELAVKQLALLAKTFVLLIILGIVLHIDSLKWLFALFQFATKPEVWIVNVSIAELQPISLGISTWILSFGKILTGLPSIDWSIFIAFVASLFIGVYLSFRKKDMIAKSSYLVLILFGILTVLKGIRFTEFASAIFLVLIASGFAHAYNYLKAEFLKKLWIGGMLIVILVTFSSGLQLASYLKPDINPNWDNAWEFLREHTPELALIGTWWDPGHMITGYAERRVIADGAHCGYDCMYTINDRITDLGKIFSTKDENQALKLLRKYQGTSPKIYWIASADLIGKFQWLQYFGTGCDARKEWNKCPLYGIAYQTNAYYSDSLEPVRIDYGEIKLLNLNYPLVFYTRGRNAILFKEIIFYKDGNVSVIDLSQRNTTELISSLKPIFKNLGFRLSSQLMDWSIWISEDKSYVVTIPPTLRDNLFTKMFFLEGSGLKNFKLVFRNPEVKIYEVKMPENLA